MSRYIVETIRYIGFPNDYRVIDTQSGVEINSLSDNGSDVLGMTEADACICAFALNAVADGMQLAAVSSRSFVTPCADGHQPSSFYEGSTEGVAP